LPSSRPLPVSYAACDPWPRDKDIETGAVEHINALAKKYRGMDTYRSPRPDEVRVMYVIEPRRVAGQG